MVRSTRSAAFRDSFTCEFPGTLFARFGPRSSPVNSLESRAFCIAFVCLQRTQVAFRPLSRTRIQQQESECFGKATSLCSISMNHNSSSFESSLQLAFRSAMAHIENLGSQPVAATATLSE